MSSDKGVIDPARNPFVCKSWVAQNLSLTQHRWNQLTNLWGMTVEEIRMVPPNSGKNPAFVAIRQRYAEIKDSRLTRTAKEWPPREVRQT